MAEEFSGLGSTFYVVLPGQSVEEMQEFKLQNLKQRFKIEDIGTSDIVPSGDGKGYQLTFEIQPSLFECSKIYRYIEKRDFTWREYQKILKETALLMALWLKDRRSVSRYIRLRRHYNRWRRSYATRKTFSTTPFHKFMHAFMVRYVAMRTYHSKCK